MYRACRLATEEDVDYLSIIDGGMEWKDWVHSTAVAEGRVLIAEENWEPIGYLRYGSFLWDDRAPFIQMIQVAAQHRRKGVATSLIEMLVASAQDLREEHGYAGVYSSAEEGNEASIKLHEKLGFTAVGTLKIPDQQKSEVVYFRPLE